MTDAKVALIVLDGWGLNKAYAGNAIHVAQTPNFDRMFDKEPHAVLEASGTSVGLPEGQMGTSEVNHLTIGAGQVVYQDLVRINTAIEQGELASKPALIELYEHLHESGGRLHVIGLISPGGVHSHTRHVEAILATACEAGVSDVLVHAITDGRDTPPEAGMSYIDGLEACMNDLGMGRIVSVIGRYYAMDRDHNWERTDKALELYLRATGETAQTAGEAVQKSYKAGITDEFIEPVWLGGTNDTILPGDGVLFVNFRNDRTRQLTERLLEHMPASVPLVTMTRYHPAYRVGVVFPPQPIPMPLGEILSTHGIRQLRVTETEKFAHMTYFLNCKHEDAYEGEDRIMLDSYSDIKTHDERPEMRAYDITQEIVQDMEAGEHQVIFANICNGDMVGHTGNFEAVVRACEVVDECLAQLEKAADTHNYVLMITADHGNADAMFDETTNDVITSHTTNPVPFIVIGSNIGSLTANRGTLVDIAPTILHLLGIEQPSHMTGKSLVA